MSADDTLLEFPCRFPVKIVGNDEAGFRAHARALVEAHTGPLAEEDVELRHSRNGRFVSLTVHVHAHSREQLDAIYESLSASERVLMAL